MEMRLLYSKQVRHRAVATRVKPMTVALKCGVGGTSEILYVNASSFVHMFQLSRLGYELEHRHSHVLVALIA
jgi:hypothetical protein